MDEDLPDFSVGFEESFAEPPQKRQKQEDQRFVTMSEDDLDKLVEGASSKSTKYATKYAVTVFKGIFH